MARHENMASWDRHRTKKELRSFIDAKISSIELLDELEQEELTNIVEKCDRAFSNVHSKLYSKHTYAIMECAVMVSHIAHGIKFL